MVVPARWMKWFITCSLLKCVFACCSKLSERVELLRFIRRSSLNACLTNFSTCKSRFERGVGFPSSTSQEENIASVESGLRLHICGSASLLRGTTPTSEPPISVHRGFEDGYGLSPGWHGYKGYLALSCSYRIEDSGMELSLHYHEIHFLFKRNSRRMAYTQRTEILISMDLIHIALRIII